jgi:lysophospholipase L1-like esterase
VKAKRWWVALFGVLAAIGLACQGAAGGVGGSPSPVAGRPDLPSSMAALGDSLTAGFGSCLALTSCPRNSWSTGDGLTVNSHYKRILAGNPAMKGNAHNFAEAGALVADLAAQATRAVAAKPAYVTILIGANDACRSRIGDMTGTSEFQAELTAALDTLKAGLPQARVLVVSIPDIYHLWQIGHTSKAATSVWSLGVCQSLLANPTSTAPADVTRRQQFQERVDAYDDLLASACQRYGPRCRWDGGAVHRAPFSLDQLSALDFFHPNASGQSHLAQVSYPGTFTWG